MSSFSTLSISREMLDNLNELKYTEMTEIQEKGIPVILDGSDILAQAKTGSGKTAAFGIGLLESINVKLFRVQAIVMCPTRELADQVATEVRKIAKFKHNIKLLTLTGGIPEYKQEQSLKHQAHIIVGTPGRVLKLLNKRALNLSHIKIAVLDEADRMLDMGFSEAIKDILGFIPGKHQTLCFSATFPDQIKKLSQTVLNNPVEVVVETQHDDTVIKQLFYKVKAKDKVSAVLPLLAWHKPDSTIIFCNTKDACKKLVQDLNRSKLGALTIHGDMEQKDRNETMIRFKNGSARVLIATDVAARGIDVNELGAVINYDLPFEKETYVHRIGRTARAGNDGLAISFMEPGEEFRMKYINEYCNSEFEAVEPDFEYSLEKPDIIPNMITISVNGGRKTKLSPGDILGTLTAKGGIEGSAVGKIDRLDYLTFIAIQKGSVQKARKVLEAAAIKGRRYKVMVNG